jgi:hypothetical protein
VSTQRRSLHRALPVPFYWLDGLIANARLPGHASAELRHRRDSAFIRLIDGGNSENLGVYSLLKRGVRNVLIADAAQDEDGKFVDICGLRRRLLNTPADILPRHLYLPGLQDFAAHCDAIEHKRFGYNMHGWLPEHPVLFGCIRHQEGLDGAEACSSLKGDEIRLFVVKPAINFPKFVRTQMGGNAKGLVSDCYVRGVDTLQADYRLNCDSAVYLKFNEGIEKGVTRGCPIFPQAGTARMTANSSADRYVAYRELARQYVSLAARAIRPLLDDEAGAAGQYEEIVRLQHGMRLRPTGSSCI